MPASGPLEIIILLVIVLLIFGPKRLPDLGRSLGRGMREFKDSVTGKDSTTTSRRLGSRRGRPTSPRAEPTPATPAERPRPRQRRRSHGRVRPVGTRTG